jgi:sulfite reductase subunit B
MKTVLELHKPESDLYIPEKAIIRKVERLTELEKLFTLELESGRSLGHDPGQFVQVAVLGVGEAPISITSPPSQDSTFQLCVRKVGEVTRKIHTLEAGDHLFIRGPLGKGFEEETMSRLRGKHLLFVAGGLGYAPVRSLVNKVLQETKEYKKITILYGCKEPGERLYTDELASIATMGGNVEFLETVDKADQNWKGNIGVITTLIPKVDFDPAETIAIVVGPPVMYKFVLISLFKQKLPEENIYLSLERRMRCGVGKCGHCQMEGVYVCLEGPVFNYADVKDNEEVF